MIISVAAQKGGSAKTTTTIHLGAALAQLGKRVLLIDMDPQGQLAEGLGLQAADLPHEISEVLDRTLALTDIIVPIAEVKNLSLAPSNIKLSYMEMQLFNKPRREDRLKNAINGLRARYDFMLIDCPPSLGILTINALSASEGVLIPMSTDYYGMLGVQLMLQTINEMREKINPHLQVLGILPTRMRPTNNAREVLGRLHEELDGNVPIYKVHIPETVKFQEAAGLGVTVFTHEPLNPGAGAYLALAKEVINVC